MRIPLEILRMVLEWAGQILPPQDLCRLRLVNGLFRDEVFEVILSSGSLGKTLRANPNSWFKLSSKLQDAYTRRQVKNHQNRPCMFSTLFLRTCKLLQDTETVTQRDDNDIDEKLVEELFQRSDFSVLRVHHFGFKSRYSVFRTGLSFERGLKLYDSHNFAVYPKVEDNLRLYMLSRATRSKVRLFDWCGPHSLLDRPADDNDERFALDALKLARSKWYPHRGVALMWTRVIQLLQPRALVEPMLKAAIQRDARKVWCLLLLAQTKRKENEDQRWEKWELEMRVLHHYLQPIMQAAQFNRREAEYLIRKFMEMRQPEELIEFLEEVWQEPFTEGSSCMLPYMYGQIGKRLDGDQWRRLERMMNEEKPKVQ
ncbi:hypothetical protein K491DRAFT_780578 [Lophiostoma macrostomum CBS 122681]|uniref:F-box domain-containing protein n=1 Tax=Lophiostoma macrostomum CBS 122681 TaxID=1314788 RepID=A0A6A6T089_9PLEO|nr:hypothetical protein K491DRAFT_780578 [Lophiostoma macrostomum CBS 122681]